MGSLGNACWITCITGTFALILGYIPEDMESIGIVGFSTHEEGSSREVENVAFALHIIMATGETLSFLHSSQPCSLEERVEAESSWVQPL